MRFLAIVLFLTLASGFCFAQEQTLEERVSYLEEQLADLPTLVERRCHLVLDFAGSSTMGCFDSVVTDVRTNVRVVNGMVYVNNWLGCKRYRLECR